MILSPDLRDIERTAQSDAERRLARLLAGVPSPESVAFWSVKLRTHAYKQMAEADFVVLWKGVAIVVEVKGGGVTKFEGLWYSTDRRGDSHRLNSSPMEQARSAMFALKEILQQDGLGWYASEAIVVTPDIQSPPASPEWRPTHWLASDSMSTSRLIAALDAVANVAPTVRRNVRAARIDELRDRLFGEFSRVPVIDAQRGAVLDEQNTATEGQARVLSGLSKNDRIVVLGGAGTGKSLVLAEAAKQEASSGRSVLITFRSPGLLQFFAPRVQDREIDIVTFDDLDERTYDVVLVDEAQDLMSAEAMDRLDVTMKGGRSLGRWRMFLDPNNQSHVHGRFDPEVVELVTSEAIAYSLSLNVRNTRAIVHMVQEYLGADVGDPGIVNGDRIRWHWVEDASIEWSLREATRLIEDGASASDIWVVPVSGTSAVPTEPSTHVRIISPRDAKGLEAEHVIVCDLPRAFDEKAIADLYVAVTRARVTLHIVATPSDKQRLQDLARKHG